MEDNSEHRAYTYHTVGQMLGGYHYTGEGFGALQNTHIKLMQHLTKSVTFFVTERSKRRRLRLSNISIFYSSPKKNPKEIHSAAAWKVLGALKMSNL